MRIENENHPDENGQWSVVTSQTWQAAQDSFEGPCLRYLRFMASLPPL